MQSKPNRSDLRDGGRVDAAGVEEREKFLEAERHAAWIRLVLSIFGVLYLLLNRADPRMDWVLGWTSIGIIWGYSLFVLVAQPYRRPAFKYVTTGLDAILTTLWIAATGGWASSWYPLYLAITVATAFRFDYRETVAAGVMYSALFAVMLAVTNTVPAGAGEELALRVVFILVIAALSGPLARRAIRHALVRAAAEEEARDAKRLDALKDQFFANVSHDLRTPLALIMGPAERLLSSEVLHESAREDVEGILRNARSLLSHVDDLLELSKLEAGRLQPDYTRMDLVALVERMTGNFDSLADELGIAFRVDVPESLRGDVDPRMFERVLQNLLANAFAFTSDGGVVRCTLRAAEAETETVVMEVADDGPGIPPEETERVFERYEGIQRSGTRRLAGGSGLGLAMVHNFVELHGGTVTVGEAPEGGALFRVELPRRAASDTIVRDEEPSSRSIPSIPLSLATGGEGRQPDEPQPAVDDRPTVLVVEDNPEMNRFIRESLAGEYRTISAFDGTQGLEKALGTPVDVIVTDIMMPQLDGEEFVREVRARPRLDTVPIIVLSARAGDESRVRLLRSGGQDYVTKPFLADELRARVGNQVKMKRTQDVLREELETTTTDLEDLANEMVRRDRQLTAVKDSLRVAYEQAERASRLKSDFLGAVSHELRTPLATLSLHLHRMERMSHELPDDARDVVERMTAQMERLNELIEGLLSYTRLKGNQLTVNPERFDPVSVVEEGIEDVRAQAEGAGLDLAVDVPDETVTFHGDEGLVRLVVLSLLGNAVKFTREGSVRVSVECSSGQLELAVSDTGPGIPPDAHMRIFEPFEQLNGPREQREGGLGLGLSLVRELVASLGGTIAVDSQLGGGTTFTVRLPELTDAHELSTDGRSGIVGRRRRRPQNEPGRPSRG